MDVIDLEERRNQKQKEEGELILTEFAVDTDMEDAVFLTRDGGVVFLSRPKELKGVHLDPDQAISLGTLLIRYGTMAQHVERFSDEEDDK